MPGVNAGTVTFTFSAAMTFIAASPVPVSCVDMSPAAGGPGRKSVAAQLGAVVSARAGVLQVN